MTQEEFNHLEEGDMVMSSASGETYLVARKGPENVVLLRTVVSDDPSMWRKVQKSLPEPPPLQWVVCRQVTKTTDRKSVVCFEFLDAALPLKWGSLASASVWEDKLEAELVASTLVETVEVVPFDS